MIIQGLSLINYRNYNSLKVDFNPALNIFIGENAQGKTNILEAIFYAATGKSHRTNYDQEIIFWGMKFFNISLIGEKKFGKTKIDIAVRADGKKMLKVNGQPKKKLSELIGAINVVLFSPEDMMLVKGGPSVRRRFLDIEISQTSPFYCHCLASYNKILNQRNNLLKAIREGKESTGLLDVWDNQLVEYGSHIMNKRAEVMEKLVPLSRKVHSMITEGREELEISYKPAINIKKDEKEAKSEDYFLKKLRENRNMEIIKGVTMTGPHRDDLVIKVGNTDLRAFGSQGQQRTAALSMKLSEVEFMKMETGEYPVLLLDDVMSELDAGRRKFLIEVVRGKIQTLVTATGIHDVFGPVMQQSRIFEVEKGHILNIQEG